MLRTLIGRSSINLSGPVIGFCLMFLMQPSKVDTISCYTCSSWNMSDPDCHDPYNPANSIYTKDCMVAKHGHIGQFPAKFCVKLIGRKVSTGEALVIRACILENMDNQCGVFRFEDDSFQGCILTCDYNGCNDAGTTRPVFYIITVTATVAAVLKGIIGLA